MLAPVVMAPAVAVVAGAWPGYTPPAAACASYSIEGGIDQPVVDASVSEPESAIIEVTATAFVHDGGEPLPNHVVWASFSMAEGLAPVEPLLTVTDIDGRVSVTLPVGATGVVFRTEAPPASGCDGSDAPESMTVPDGVVPDGVFPDGDLLADPDEPGVVMVEIPADSGVLNPAESGPEPDPLATPGAAPVASVATSALPRTGPGAGGFVLGGLAVAGGVGLVLGRRRPVVPG